jgi:hypothetical protein
VRRQFQPRTGCGPRLRQPCLGRGSARSLQRTQDPGLGSLSGPGAEQPGCVQDRALKTSVPKVLRPGAAA